MIFWYKDLYMDEKVRKQEKKCKKIIEERSIFQKLPWKKSFYIITLAENEKNLFEIMNTDQLFFKYYGQKELYVIGVTSDYDAAVSSRFYAKAMRHRKSFLRNRYLKRRIFRDRRKVM